MSISDSTSSPFHHIEINVSSLEASRRFWGWLLERLGYTLYQDWEFGFSYKLGAQYMVFVQTEQQYLNHSYHRKHTGLNHIAFHADNADIVDQLTDALRSRDVPILYGDRHPYAGGGSTYSVFFEDPDRIKVEVVFDRAQ